MVPYSSDQPYNELPPLPPPVALDTPVLLRAALKANRLLAELKGYCQTLPNPELLLNTVALQESKDSSAIENIVTTQDELYQAIINPFDSLPVNTKEVLSYRQAIYAGWEEWKTTGFFSTKLAITIMQRIKHTGATLRNTPGTRLFNPATKKTTYTPPDPQYLPEKLSQWERFITNIDEETDPLITMALMHYQFEAIHPFADGNGRTGRILNVLYLVHCGLLTMPVLYHSRHIIQHKE
jgi:Fic family protein